jgi:hypothetical protein
MKYLLLLLLFIPLFVFAQAKSSLFSTGEHLLGLVSLLGFAVFIYVDYKKDKTEREKYIKYIEAKYKAALAGTDKIRALELGTLYISALREGGDPTAEDKQMLSRDLSQMKTFGSVKHSEGI